MHNEYLVSYEFLDTEGNITSAAETLKAVDLTEARTKGEDVVIGRRILDPMVNEVSDARVRLFRIHCWK